MVQHMQNKLGVNEAQSGLSYTYWKKTTTKKP